MKKALLTGIDGFTGKYVADLLLQQGYDVIGLVYKNPKQGEVACDLTKKRATSSMNKSLTRLEKSFCLFTITLTMLVLSILWLFPTLWNPKRN